MKSLRQQIENALENSVKELTGEETPVSLEQSSNPSFGDYASNIALVLSKKLQRNPMEIAEKIAKAISYQLSAINLVDKIEVAKPGFINFWISQEFLSNSTYQLLNRDDKIELSGKLKDRKIVVEFTDPNPFKEFHIGHLRNIILGESYSRLLEAVGARVFRVNYQGDVGLHVAKAILGIKKHESRIKDLEHQSIDEKVKFLGEMYALGSEKYETEPEAKKAIGELNKKIYQKDPEIMDLYQKGRQWSLQGFEQIYKRVGTKFEQYYFESQVTEPGLAIVKEHVNDGIFEESEGAIVFKGEKEGLHTRVFVTKEGYPTYEGKDMALPGLKYKDFAYDESIILTAHEQTSYFKVLLAAITAVFPDLGKKTKHYAFGFVSLKEGKMSSRSGNVITGQWLLDEAKREILQEFPEMDEETAEKVAVGAVKYSMLKFAPASDISFSFKESVSLEGNSGPYIQYAFARTQSVLAKLPPAMPGNWRADKTRAQSSKLNEEELRLMRIIFRFDEVVGQAAEGFAPNLLANYLFELAQRFNLFYQKHKILESDQKDFRLGLTAVVGKVLRQGLRLLGIEAPEKM